MKKMFLLLAVIGLCNTINAQSLFNMKIKKFGISASYDKDMINDINADYFMKISKDGVYNDLSEMNFEDKDIASMVCENPGKITNIHVLDLKSCQKTTVFDTISGRVRESEKRLKNIPQNFLGSILEC